MVLQKRLDYGTSGYQVPAMPHVPRSAKGKRSVRKKVEENQMCAFDLLVSVAGKLLSEGESSSSPYNVSESNNSGSKNGIKDYQLTKEKVFNVEAIDRQSSNYSLLDSDFVRQRESDCELKEQPLSLRAAASADSAFVKSDLSDKDVIARESTVVGNNYGFRNDVVVLAEKCSTQGRCSSSGDIHEHKREGLKTPLQVEQKPARNSTYEKPQNMYIPEDPMDLDTKAPSWVSSDSSAEVSLYRSQNNPLLKHEDALELDIDKDDDEDSSGCTHHSILLNKTSKLQRIGDHRIRKLLPSKYWKVAPTKSQDNEHFDYEEKPFFCGKKMCYTRQRTQRSTFKREKFLERFSVSKSGGLHRDKTPNICEKSAIKLEANDLHSSLDRATGASSSTSGQRSRYETPEYHVKLSIKSFKVPELFIEISENATVGSLKKTIMETVTALLGGGLHVGVLLQGKKIRDDNKTLRQAGISHSDKLDNLGFTLEPNTTQAPAPLTISHDPVLLNLCEPAEPLARIPPPVDPPAVDPGGSVVAIPPPAIISCHESDHDSVHSPAVETLQLAKAETNSNSRALVAVPNAAESLAMVPPPRKSRRCEVVQRRIRRPFTVAEVEALVQTVEKLGTGRWRDVKLRAFDNAKHRTYVDLKDKWKTLVHTARISPQQRRGEPVPQELLDRVLLAHAYWSQQQAKLQVKPSPPPPPTSAEPCLLLQ